MIKKTYIQDMAKMRTLAKKNRKLSKSNVGNFEVNDLQEPGSGLASSQQDRCPHSPEFTLAIDANTSEIDISCHEVASYILSGKFIKRLGDYLESNPGLSAALATGRAEETREIEFSYYEIEDLIQELAVYIFKKLKRRPDLAPKFRVNRKGGKNYLFEVACNYLRQVARDLSKAWQKGRIYPSYSLHAPVDLGDGETVLHIDILPCKNPSHMETNEAICHSDAQVPKRNSMMRKARRKGIKCKSYDLYWRLKRATYGRWRRKR